MENLMSDVEYIANMAEIISGLAVIIGIGFGVVEYLRHKANERRELNGPQAGSGTSGWPSKLRRAIGNPHAFQHISPTKLKGGLN